MPVDSEKSKATEAALAPELHSTYRQLVEEYERLTTLKYGRGYVAYEVLAGLVISGWRPTADTKIGQSSK